MAGLDDRVSVKNMQIRNRLVFPPITTNYGMADGRVTKDILSFYEIRSRHVGMTIVEATAVNESGRIVPNSLGLWNDDQMTGMRDLVKTIRQKGAAAAIQLNHAGPRCSPDPGLKQGFSPSGVAFRPDVKPVIMDNENIQQLIDDFRCAAVRAKEVGFDAVEIHGAHLYLLSQFISPLTNKREDDYGGDITGRCRLAIEIVRSIRKSVGEGYPLLFRLNAEERVEGGLTAEDSMKAGSLLAEAGVDLFDISLIAYGGFKEVDGNKVLVGSSALPKEKPPGANVSLTAAFKQNVKCPVIAVGKFGAGGHAALAVEKQHIDMVALGRQMICDPETAGKILLGHDNDIIPCDECFACFASIGKGKPMACKVNKNLPL